MLVSPEMMFVEILNFSTFPWLQRKHKDDPRPPLNKKLFPIHQPGGLKRADRDFFFIFFMIFGIHPADRKRFFT